MTPALLPRDALDPLSRVDIVLSVFNQEKIIERVLEGIFKNTVTPFTLILIFDGCTDTSEATALAYIELHKPELLQKTIVREAPNVFETKANNIGFKLVESPYFLTLQDDMVIAEPGWDIRLTYPLRKWSNVLGVSARMALDIDRIENGRIFYTHKAGRELLNLPRSRFAVRDVINRGPIAFCTAHLKALNFLDESYAPCMLDDADLALRAWRDRQLVCGAFTINYISKVSWGKSRQSDSTIGVSASGIRNAILLQKRFGDYLRSGQKHNQTGIVPFKEINYPVSMKRIALTWTLLKAEIPFLFGRFSFLVQRGIGRISRGVMRRLKK